MKTLRIGCVQYLNARPLIHGWHGKVVFGHPSTLCQQLASGELDIALVSSYEFLRNPVYRIVDGIAIASDGTVYSVFVAHEPGSLPSAIELDPASTTASAMVQCLAAEQRQVFSALSAPADPLSPLCSNRARLLIGDQAISFRQKFAARYYYRDLGQEWKRLTRIPFVYALWLVRPEVSEAKTIADQLRARRDANLGDLEAVIAAEQTMDRAFCRHYYRQYLRFSFAEREKEGLRLFHATCVKHGILTANELAFSLI